MLTWADGDMRWCWHEAMLPRDGVDTSWCWHEMMLTRDGVDIRKWCWQEAMLPWNDVATSLCQHRLVSTMHMIVWCQHHWPVSTSTRVNIVSFHADTRWCWQYSMLTWGGADTRQQFITTLHFILFDVAVRDLHDVHMRWCWCEAWFWYSYLCMRLVVDLVLRSNV